MDKIKNIEMLLALTPGTQVYKIEYGDCKPLIYVGPHPKMKEAAVFIHSSSHLKAEVIIERDIQYNNYLELRVGVYDSDKVGKIMIDQLQKQVDTIKKIYLDEK